MNNPLEECCPVCERKGGIVRFRKSMLFKIDGKWTDIHYTVYKCTICLGEFITTEPETDPFQKAKDLGWVKG